MTIRVRRTRTGDLELALRLEGLGAGLTASDLTRAFEGQRGERVWMAFLDREPAGYLVAGHFFDHPLVEQLQVDSRFRRLGVASRLMAALEEDTPDRVFVSTNESNQPMRTLLVGRGYKVSGIIEDLDPGDPELFFVRFAGDLA